MATAQLDWDAVSGVDGYNAYIKGAPINYWLVFDGVDQYAELDIGDFVSEFGEMSVEFDFISNSTSDNYLLGISDSSSDFLFRIHINRNNNEAADAGKMCIQLRSSNGQRRRYGFVNDEVINDGNRHHLAVTVNVDTVKVYLDGTEVSIELTSFSNWGESLVGATWTDITEKFFIGAGNNGGTAGDFHDCQITNLRFWTVERTATEIDDNKDVYLEGTEANLFANYLLKEGTGDTIEDSAGDGDGTLVNNSSDDMWDLDEDSVSDDFVKDNTSLILTNTYDITFLNAGDYETYVTAVLGELESDPSNTVEFTVT